MSSIDEERGAGREFRRHIVRTLDAIDKRQDRQDDRMHRHADRMDCQDTRFAALEKQARNILLTILAAVLGIVAALLRG